MASPLSGLFLVGTIGDVDDDGDDDLLAGTPTGPQIILSGGNGSFTLGPMVPITDSIIDVQCGDLDGDGSTDLLVLATPTGSPSIPLTTVSILRGVSGMFVVDLEFSLSTSHRRAHLDDRNGDGALDIVLGGNPCGAQYFITLMSELPQSP